MGPVDCCGRINTSQQQASTSILSNCAKCHKGYGRVQTPLKPDGLEEDGTENVLGCGNCTCKGPEMGKSLESQASIQSVSESFWFYFPTISRMVHFSPPPWTTLPTRIKGEQCGRSTEGKGKWPETLAGARSCRTREALEESLAEPEMQ